MQEKGSEGQLDEEGKCSQRFLFYVSYLFPILSLDCHVLVRSTVHVCTAHTYIHAVHIICTLELLRENLG